MRTILNRASVVAVIAVAVAVSGATSANAAAKGKPDAVHPQMCQPDLTTDVSGAVGSFVPDSGKRVYGAAGTTLTISAAAGTTWSGTIGGSGSVDESAIILSAVQTVSASISYSKTTTVSLGGSWTVPKGDSSGWLALGSMGYSMKWSTGEYNGNCTWRTLGSGTASLPAESPFIDHS